MAPGAIVNELCDIPLKGISMQYNFLSPFSKDTVVFNDRQYIFNKSKFKFRRAQSIKLNLSRTYTSKPLVYFNNEILFPEIALVNLFKNNNWNAFWIDSFHKKLWDTMPANNELSEIPMGAFLIFSKLTIEKNIFSQGAWDIFAWYGDDYLFVECKGIPSKDKIRKTQLQFFKKSIKNGLKKENFLILEWDYE